MGSLYMSEIMSLKFKTNIILERRAKIKIFIIIRKSNVLPVSRIV